MIQICETLDRLATIEVRGIGTAPWSGITYKLYNAAKGKNAITYDIVSLLQNSKDKIIAITTGSLVPEKYPIGENDGPLGAIVLGRSLLKRGFRVRFYLEEEIHPFMNALAEMYKLKIELFSLTKDSKDNHLNLKNDSDILITIEKAGGNETGHLHSIKGASHDGNRANIDGWIKGMRSMKKPIISIGDGGNEVGFGKIFEEANQIIPNAKKCNCPCGGSIISYQEADYLLPASTSNWGAYAVAAAFALLEKNPNLFINPDDEYKMLELAMKMGVKDGGVGILGMTIDGIPAQTSAAIVQLLRSVVERALL